MAWIRFRTEDDGHQFIEISVLEDCPEGFRSITQADVERLGSDVKSPDDVERWIQEKTAAQFVRTYPSISVKMPAHLRQ